MMCDLFTSNEINEAITSVTIRMLKNEDIEIAADHQDIRRMQQICQ